jgi:hypothetical protein
VGGRHPIRSVACGLRSHLSNAGPWRAGANDSLRSSPAGLPDLGGPAFLFPTPGKHLPHRVRSRKLAACRSEPGAPRLCSAAHGLRRGLSAGRARGSSAKASFHFSPQAIAHGRPCVLLLRTFSLFRILPAVRLVGQQNRCRLLPDSISPRGENPSAEFGPRAGPAARLFGGGLPQPGVGLSGSLQRRGMASAVRAGRREAAGVRHTAAA